MFQELEGRSIIVTGAGRGIGTAIADIDGDAAEATASAVRETGGEAQAVDGGMVFS